MKRKKTRSVASYRAASLKGARTRQLMDVMRYRDTIKQYEAFKTGLAKPQTSYRALPNPWFDMVRK